MVAVLDLLKNSDYRATATGRANGPRFANRARFRGHRGNFIQMHRALVRFVLEPLDLVLSILLVLLILSRGWHSCLAFVGSGEIYSRAELSCWR